MLEPQQDIGTKMSECLKALERNHLRRQEKSIAQRMTEISFDQRDELDALMKERKEIRRILQQLQQPAA